MSLISHPKRSWQLNTDLNFPPENPLFFRNNTWQNRLSDLCCFVLFFSLFLLHILFAECRSLSRGVGRQNSLVVVNKWSESSWRLPSPDLSTLCLINAFNYVAVLIFFECAQTWEAHALKKEKRGKHPRVLDMWCISFKLHSPRSSGQHTQEKQIINSPVGHNTQME